VEINSYVKVIIPNSSVALFMAEGIIRTKTRYNPGETYGHDVVW
jgi:hypothetical protein